MGDCPLAARFESLRCTRLIEANETKAPWVDASPGVELYQLDPDGRAPLGVSEGDKICDGAVWFEEDQLLLLVEIKCGQFREADEQLASTLRGWRRQNCPVTVECVVVMTGSAPLDGPKKVKRFRNQHKATLRILHSRKSTPSKKNPPNSRRISPSELRSGR